jgi:putative ABC transport system ATP-binding protein
MKIEIKNLSKEYFEKNHKIAILNDVSITFKESEIVAILGKSGSGKTTLLSMLAGIERPTSGSININGVEITDLSEDELCEWRGKNIGIVFQQFFLVGHLTALENVNLGMEISHNSNLDKAKEWLSLVQLSDRLNHFPMMLSGGEQQRVAIARALASNPSVILADEPSGNLDSETGNIVMDLMFKIVREKKLSLILVTHDEELARRADRVVRLSQGRCV